MGISYCEGSSNTGASLVCSSKMNINKYSSAGIAVDQEASGRSPLEVVGRVSFDL